MALNFPNSPTANQIFTDSTTGNRYLWDSTNGVWRWTPNTVSVVIQSLAPGSPSPGQLWWNTELGRLYIYYTDADSSQWVEASPSSASIDVATLTSYVNAASDIAKAAYVVANLGFAFANSVMGFTNGAFNTANSAYNVANAAFGVANVSFTMSNAMFSWVYVTTNAAFDTANVVFPAYTTANAAFDRTNGVYLLTNNAFTTANAAIASAAGAVSAASQVTAAYNQANTALAATQFVVNNNATTLINTGYTTASFNAGDNVAAYGTWTPNPTNGNYQYATSNGSVTIAAPSQNCGIDILITNGIGANTISFTGFTVGSAAGTYANTSGNRFILTVRRINNISTYSWYPLQ